MLMILFIRSKLKAIPPLIGKAPPLSPVLAPEGVTEILWALQYFKISATSFVVEGFNTICGRNRSEEHTSELQSRPHLVCRLLLEKKKKKKILITTIIKKI